MGVNVLNNTSSQEVLITAGSAISAGDLVVNAESGAAYAGSAALTIAQNNNTTSGPSAIFNTNNGSSSYYGNLSASRQNICQLSNETLVLAYIGNGSTNRQTTVNLVFKTLQDAAPIPPIAIGNTGGYWVEVRPLSSGFVALWTNGASDLRFAIYNNNGSIVLSDTLVSASVNNYSDLSYFDLAVTTNNEIVIAYNVSGSSIRFKRYNSSGVLQGSEVTVQSVVNTRELKIITDFSGGFVIYYSTSGGDWRFGRYNSSGTLQGSLTTVASSNQSFNGGNFLNLGIRLPNGNFVVFYPDQGTARPFFSVYNSSGSAVRSAIDFSGSGGVAAANVVPAICVSGLGFTIFSKGSNSNGYFFIYDQNGNGVQSRTSTSYTSWNGLFNILSYANSLNILYLLMSNILHP